MCEFRLSVYWQILHSQNKMSFMYSMFALVGLFSCVKILMRLFFTIQMYRRRSSLMQYHSNSSWALVTGASDGIGKAIASELSSRGFKVILHGRNRAKLEMVAKELEGETMILVVDGSTFSKNDIERMKQELGSLEISVLINNVSIANDFQTLDELSPETIDSVIRLNISFVTHLTRIVLPSLKRQTHSLIITIGSYAGIHPPGTLSVYASSKSFQHTLSESLRREASPGMRVELHVAGSVVSSSNRAAQSFMRPTSAIFARAVCDHVGAANIIAPYWPHAILTWTFGIMPTSWIDYISKKTMKTIKDGKNN
jgi:17beta-estradiol 17-dehydrogenase / very-long-chain 3-oxoacyl-CoA reductase